MAYGMAKWLTGSLACLFFGILSLAFAVGSGPAQAHCCCPPHAHQRVAQKPRPKGVQPSIRVYEERWTTTEVWTTVHEPYPVYIPVPVETAIPQGEAPLPCDQVYGGYPSTQQVNYPQYYGYQTAPQPTRQIQKNVWITFTYGGTGTQLWVYLVPGFNPDAERSSQLRSGILIAVVQAAPSGGFYVDGFQMSRYGALVICANNNDGTGWVRGPEFTSAIHVGQILDRYRNVLSIPIAPGGRVVYHR